MPRFEWTTRYRAAHERIWNPPPKAAPPPPEPEPAPPSCLAPCGRCVAEHPVRIITRAVAAHFGTSSAVIRSPARHRAVIVPRFLAIRLARELTTLSLPQIGRHFRRDHTTVLHALERIETMMQHDPKLADTFALLRTQARTLINEQRQGVKA